MTTWERKMVWPTNDEMMAGDPAATRQWHDDSMNAGSRALLNAIIEAVKKNPDLAEKLMVALRLSSRP